MNKKILFVVLFVFASVVASFGFSYWWLDVYVDDYMEGWAERPTTQRVYLFKDLASFQQAVGQNNFRWTPHTRRPYRYQQIIYDTMRAEGFSYAFILAERGAPRNQPPYWIYAAYTLRNGVEYTDVLTREYQGIQF